MVAKGDGAEEAMYICVVHRPADSGMGGICELG